jgi:crotonobetainyl-CoA:carnitine CoA-transferase CaiB-like acyl-CoA transferase
MNTNAPNQGSRPLDGIRVLDLTVALAGPYASLLLGGLGAEVIRVESPSGGDIARGHPPFVGNNGLNFGAKQDGEVSLSILQRARNKKSVTLDLKSVKGRELLMRLAKECDVVLENMSEGVTERLGIDYESISSANPKIIYASIKAFGEPSPYPALKGMDVIVQALSGLMEVTGFTDGPPTRCGIPISDLVAPLFAINGILCALIYRGRTGEGQHVKVSMLDCMASLIAEEHFDVFGKAGFPVRSGNSQDRHVPFGAFRSKDGHVAIVAFTPEWMKGLLDAMGQPQLMEDPRFSSRGPRVKNATQLNALIEEWTRRHTSEEVVCELLQKRNVPAARVRTPTEMLNDPHLRESGAVVELEHATLGKIGALGAGLPIQFSRSTAQLDEPATELGAANEQVYGELLKLTREEVGALRAAGVI